MLHAVAYYVRLISHLITPHFASAIYFIIYFAENFYTHPPQKLYYIVAIFITHNTRLSPRQPGAFPTGFSPSLKRKNRHTDDCRTHPLAMTVNHHRRPAVIHKTASHSLAGSVLWPPPWRALAILQFDFSSFYDCLAFQRHRRVGPTLSLSEKKHHAHFNEIVIII